jgi:RNA polymerase sigma-70 factor, ECF subfamily
MMHLHRGIQTDEQLMLQAAQGCEAAFAEIYRRYARRLQGFFFRQVGGDAEQAADLMQETFLKAFAAKKGYRPGTDVSPWLFTIAYNLCRNVYRRQGHELMPLTQNELNSVAADDVEVDIDSHILSAALSEVLGQLPSEARLLFSLHYEEEMSVPQLAQMYGLPEGTVKSRLHRIMNLIKSKLKRYETQ